jgi:hypothetical protein
MIHEASETPFSTVLGMLFRIHAPALHDELCKVREAGLKLLVKRVPRPARKLLKTRRAIRIQDSLGVFFAAMIHEASETPFSTVLGKLYGIHASALRDESSKVRETGLKLFVKRVPRPARKLPKTRRAIRTEDSLGVCDSLFVGPACQPRLDTIQCSLDGEFA